MADQTETFEGYVMDQRCMTTRAHDELLDAAKDHTTECALAGKCMESGYGLVGEDGDVVLLDPDATPKVVATLRNTDEEEAVELRVERTADEDDNLQTQSVEQV